MNAILRLRLCSDERNLFFDNAGTVVLHTDFVFIFADGFDMHPDFGETLLASGAASSQASRELSTASLTVVRSALRGLSNPSRCRFLAKNSLTDISFCDFAISSAEGRRLRLMFFSGADMP